MKDISEALPDAQGDTSVTTTAAADADISDLEMTRLCAKAMGYGVSARQLTAPAIAIVRTATSPSEYYNPLRNDAQAMQLVKRFELSIAWSWAHQCGVAGKPSDEEPLAFDCRHTNLNRAIVECVAKAQATKDAAAGVNPADVARSTTKHEANGPDGCLLNPTQGKPDLSKFAPVPVPNEFIDADGKPR